MRDGHSCVRLQGHLEHVDAAIGRILALQEFQREAAKVDGFGHEKLQLR
jgi:hypothetical protein